MSTDRSNAERIRRLKAITIAHGRRSKFNVDYETLMVKQFGESRYLYQQGNGAILEQNCCPSASDSAMWVAVGEDTLGNSILYSLDGKSWFVAKGSFGGGGYYGVDVAFGNDIWVSTGYDSLGNNLKWSPNGIEWHNANYTTFDDGKCVAYGGDKWIAVDTNGHIVTSTNGQEWTDGDGIYFGGGGIYDLAYGKDTYDVPLWVAVGKNGIFWSPNGSDWNVSSGSSFGGDGGGGGYGVAYGRHKWVALGVSDLSGNAALWSPDGQYWYDSSGPQFGGLNGHGIAYDGDIWVSSGNPVNDGDASGNTMLWSPNGESWNRTFGSQLGGGGWYGAVAYGNTTWVTVGHPDVSGNTIMWSPDGIQWSPANVPMFDTYGNGIAFRRTL